MNLDFHYYGTYAAAVMAGFEPAEAEIIAYSAQFVDDYYDQRAIAAGIEKHTPTVAKIETLGDYASEYRKDNLTHAAEWMPFHFLPSFDLDYYKRYKSILPNHLLCMLTRPRGGALETPLLKRVALPPSDAPYEQRIEALIGIGMICHTYADTWAHQDFAGFNCEVLNNVYGNAEVVSIKIEAGTVEGKYEKKGLGIFASGDRTSKDVYYLGHGTVGHLPDLSNIVYTYHPYWLFNDKEPNESKAFPPYTRCNPDTFFQAFVFMRNYLANVKRGLTGYEQLAKEFDDPLKALFAYNGDPIVQWKTFIQRELRQIVPKDFNAELWPEQYKKTYPNAKNNTFLAMFDRHAKAQKKLVYDECVMNGFDIKSIVKP